MANFSNNNPSCLNPVSEVMMHVEQANKNAERAYWWLKNIDRDDVRRFGIEEKVLQTLNLLQKVDNITTDIQKQLIINSDLLKCLIGNKDISGNL